MRVSVNVEFAIDDTQQYAAQLTIPGELKAEDPFKFIVQQKNGEKENNDTVVDVAVVNKDMVRVAVAPPESLMKVAHIDSIVKSLNVVVEAGEYDEEHGVFTSKTTPEIPQNEE